MIDKNLVKRYIVEFHEKDFSDVKKRELKINFLKNKATCIIGPRRAGKTYLLFSLIDNPEKYLYIDFENPIFYNISPKDIIYILDAYFELYPENKQVNVFLDEVQVIRDWERTVRYLIDKGFKVAVSGSSSKLMSQEIATHLRGRALIYTLLPLSFRETLEFKNVKYGAREFYLNYNKIKNILSETLKYGSYPEVVLSNEKERILKEYLELIVRKDILERYSIRNRFLINELIYFAINNYSKYVSYDSLFKLFKQRIKITKRTIINYISYFEDSMLFFLLRKFEHSVKARIVSPRKIYLIDIGLGIFGKKDIARDMENYVFLELLRRKSYYNPLSEIFYWKDYQGREVDFVVKEGFRVKQLIQVTYASEKDEIEKREIKALVKASKLLKCKNLLVITWDYEDEIVVNNLKIKFLPLWKWLLHEKFKNI